MSARLTPEAGRTVAVVARGRGGSGSPRPNTALATTNRTAATKMSTSRYSSTIVTPPILPDAPDSARPTGGRLTLPQGVHRRPIGQRDERQPRGVAVTVGEELGEPDPGVIDAAARQQRGDDLPAHSTQLGQRPVAVGTYTEVDLRDRVQAEPVIGVDEQADLHAVARRERHRHQQLTGRGVFAAQGLEDAAQPGPQRRQQRPRDQLGDPTAAVGVLAAADLQRPTVKALDKVDAVDRQQRADQPWHEHRVGVDQVGVDEQDDVAAGGGERPPQHLTLAGMRGQLGQRLLPADNAGPGGDGADLRLVGGAGVKHDQFVDQPAEHRRDAVDHRRDRFLLVQRRQHHRDRAARFGGLQFGNGPGRSAQAMAGHPFVAGQVLGGQLWCSGHASPLTVRVGARTPSIAATMSRTRRVCPTSWTRNIRTPAAAARAVAARVPSRRSAKPTPKVSPTKSLLLSAISTGHPVLTRSFTWCNKASPWKVFLPKSWVGSIRIASFDTPAAAARSAAAVTSAMTSSTTPRVLVP